MVRFSALPILAVVAAAVGIRLTDAPDARPAPSLPLAAFGEPSPEPPAPIPLPAPEIAVPQQAPPPPPAAQDRLTVEELKKLAEARFTDETILAYARVSGRAFRPTPEDLIALKEAGMTDALLSRLMGAPAPASPAAPAAPPPVPERAAEPAPAAIVVTPPPVYVYPTTAVYAPVEVTVVAPVPVQEAVEYPVIQTVFVCASHRRPGCCAGMPPPRQESTFFKTREWMPTKRLPTAEEAARRAK